MPQGKERLTIEHRVLSILKALSRRSHMKLVSTVCLCVFTGFLFVPIDVGIVYLPCDDKVAFATLDVCHAASSAVYGNPDMPSLYQSPREVAAPEFLCVISVKNPAFKPLLVVHEKDRPPQS